MVIGTPIEHNVYGDVSRIGISLSGMSNALFGE
jgi:hypothetical protein